jgi:hypothetical protein
MSNNAFHAILSGLIFDIEQEVEMLMLAYDRQKINLASSDKIDKFCAASVLASIISKIYTKSEDVFYKVAQKIDSDVPSGDGWHSMLLRQMKADLTDRPAFISHDSFVAFDHLRRFRHFERNSYASVIDAEMIPEKVRITDEAISLLRRDFMEFSYVFFEIERPKENLHQPKP